MQLTILLGNILIYKNILIYVSYVHYAMFRFPENHTIVFKLLNVTEKCFVDESCNIELFNNVALHAVNVIYQVSFIS